MPTPCRSCRALCRAFVIASMAVRLSLCQVRRARHRPRCGDYSIGHFRWAYGFLLIVDTPLQPDDNPSRIAVWWIDTVGNVRNDRKRRRAQQSRDRDGTAHGAIHIFRDTRVADTAAKTEHQTEQQKRLAVRTLGGIRQLGRFEDLIALAALVALELQRY